MKTQFSIYCIGQVAKDIDGSETWETEIYPIELLPSTSGTLGTEDAKAREFKDAAGKSYSYSVSSSNTITATWLPFGDYNRATAPCVRKGEYVVVFRYGGEDKFFWIPLFMEADLRNKERAIWFFSNKEQVDNIEDMQSQAYFFKVDTIDQQVQLHTDASQGEGCGYDLYLDTSSGTFLLQDTLNNTIELKSVDGILNVTINKDKNLKLGNDLNILVDNNATMDVTKDMSVTNDTFKMNANKTAEITCGESMSVQLKTFAVKNDNGELIAILLDLIDAILQEQHLGNLGAPTSLMPTSISKYQEIKSKLSTFKM